MAEDPDMALSMLADMTGATDERLRELARRLAGRVVVDLARTGPGRRRGVGRLRRAPLDRAEGDVDVDASLDALRERRAGIRHDTAGVVVGTWEKPETAVCLLVDRSGSMAGDRLASAAVAAATIVHRVPACAVVAFAEEAVVIKAMDEHRGVEDVVGDVLRLRGRGVTDVGLALRTARRQLERSDAGRRLALLLSDCRATTGGDPLAGTVGPPELAVLAPAGDSADAARLAEALGAPWAELAGPSSVPEAVGRLLDS